MSYSEITLTAHDSVELHDHDFSYDVELKIEMAFEAFLDNLSIDELFDDVCGSLDWDTFQIELARALDEDVLQQQLKHLSLNSNEPITFFIQKNEANHVITFGLQQTDDFVVNLQALMPQSYIHSTSGVDDSIKPVEATFSRSYDMAGGFFSKNNMLTCAAGVAAVVAVATTLYAASK
tara:strand:- start:170463 stop:170996 length:534 start_codon:yes stop_codon:yes gene_type:complete